MKLSMHGADAFTVPGTTNGGDIVPPPEPGACVITTHVCCGGFAEIKRIETVTISHLSELVRIVYAHVCLSNYLCVAGGIFKSK